MAAWTAAWWAVLVVWAVALPAAADPPGRVGRLADAVGGVFQADPQTGEWLEAVRNVPLVGGDRLRTARDGRAVVQVGSATLRLAGDTEVQWLQLDDEAVRVALVAGSVGLRVRSAEVAREFEIATPQGRFLPRFAGHYRVDRRFDALGEVAAGQSIVGELVFDADDSRKRIDAGQRFEFWQRGQPPVTYHAAVAATNDDFGLWLLAEEKAEPREVVATRYVSPETTGWQDLDRHGRWDRHPSYGVVWVPVGVPVGWAPYRYGRWIWVRPWGWTWVDAAPWGFAPFHYGRWVWWGATWAWVPGPYVARPVYSPALVGWIGAPGISVGISIGSGPWVGWVPLAPHDVYRPWYPVSPRHPHYRTPPPRPVPRDAAVDYRHLATPGALTVVDGDALGRRQPIGERDLRRVDPDTARRIAQRPDVATAPPPWRRPPDALPPRRAAPDVAGAPPPPAALPADRTPRRVVPLPEPASAPGRTDAAERAPRPVPRDAREYRDGRDEWRRRDEAVDRAGRSDRDDGRDRGDRRDGAPVATPWPAEPGPRPAPPPRFVERTPPAPPAEAPAAPAAAPAVPSAAPPTARPAAPASPVPTLPWGLRAAPPAAADGSTEAAIDRWRWPADEAARRAPTLPAPSAPSTAPATAASALAPPPSAAVPGVAPAVDTPRRRDDRERAPAVPRGDPRARQQALP